MTRFSDELTLTRCRTCQTPRGAFCSVAPADAVAVGVPEEAGIGSGKGLERRESEKRGLEREGALGAREGPRVPAVW